MDHLKIPHQILDANFTSQIDPGSKVVCISPEKILDPVVIKQITKLEWSCICIDEPHLALIWGTSKSKHTKPFRDAFSKLSHLNNLKACFELHSATIFDEDKIFQLLGRKDSKWVKQIELPNRENLTLYLVTGKSAPDNILSLPSVSQAFEDDNGLLLIFVQRIADGSSIHLELLEYCELNGHVKFCPKKEKPFKPVAFLHSSLSEEAKKQIFADTHEKRLRVLIATNSAGSGINIPVTQFIGWGLDPEPCGLIQAMGRTCRKPVISEGPVIWVHNSKIHGRRVPRTSQVRDWLNGDSCLRKTSNAWFSHDLQKEQNDTKPEFCCSRCMEKCIEKSNCQDCRVKLSKYMPSTTYEFNNKSANKILTEFLKQLKINEMIPEVAFPFKEESLSEEILKFIDVSKSITDLKEFLLIFSLGEKLNHQIHCFIKNEWNHFLSTNDKDEAEYESCSTDSSVSENNESESDKSSEYFDDDEI